MPEVPDFQRILLRQAAKDLRAAEVLGREVDRDVEIVGFHLQQAVEKALKAVLETRRIAYPLTHDLVKLRQLLGEASGECPVGLDEARTLNPFAVRFRYEDVEQDDSSEADLDVAQGIETASRAVAWARKIVEGR